MITVFFVTVRLQGQASGAVIAFSGISHKLTIFFGWIIIKYIQKGEDWMCGV